MASSTTRVYRSAVRELYKSSVKPRQISRVLTSNFRDILQKSEANVEAVANAVNFMTAQREHKVLLDRYNPLFDLTAEERIEATAHRVGLNMPKLHNPEEK